ncbi:MAG: ribonuclease P protein component [Agromyces sp.]
MLARANRVIRADEFRSAIRRGQKVSVASCVISIFRTAQGDPVRFGFIVGKNVGNAVIRNRLRRRMRAAAFDIVRSGVTGMNVVVRALPAASENSVQSFREAFESTVAQR